jgi:hypothetical protein
MRLPPGLLIAVYLDKALNVWEWRLESAGEDPLTPADPDARFGKRLF